MLGNGEAPGDMIPAEFRNNLFHKKGALAMARTDNPEKASSNCQFYIVQGKPYNDTVLNIWNVVYGKTILNFSYTDDSEKYIKQLAAHLF